MNLAARLRDSATRLPDTAALVIPAGSDDARSLSYRELDERVEAAAAAFAGAGLAAGDRVAVLLGNSRHFIEAVYGAWRAGLTVVPLNTALAAQEVATVLAGSRAKAVVVSEAFAGVLHGVREALPALERVVVAGATHPPMGTRTWNQFLRGGGETPSRVVGAARSGGELALLAYTSGTTGRAKGAMLTHDNLLANQRQMERTRLRVDQGDVVLCALPLFHIYALNVAMGLTLSRGATLLLMDRFDPVQSLEAVARHRASVIVGAPPMYVAWLNLPGAGGDDLGSVRLAVSGAAPLPRRVLEGFATGFGVTIWEGYGLTETSPVLTTAAMSPRPRPGSVGRPLPDVELRLLDDKGRDVAPGDPGEVVVRGPNVFGGYLDDPTATAAVLDPDGWFATGDVGLFDDGDLFLVDRKSDLIIVSGFNVYPREVEEVLSRHPKVAEAAVVGTPHPYTGEAVKAVVVLRPGEEATADDITEFCRRSLARFKAPEVVEFAAELPHTASGKVARRHLRRDRGPQGSGR
ncbi:MAG: AMP-binding protein [Euzebyales bacterium]|nr:AMP-binding protein [Euzebyales bacterium]